MKLVDVPEMNYTVNDKPEPRGEIWLRGSSIFKGYYKEPAKTKAVLLDDGWFATGDIGKWRSEGRLEIIDRKKNIFKLSQGEYIRPEYIQNVYKLNKFVGSIYVYGNSLQRYLVAIVVPDWEVLIPFIKDNANKMGLIHLIDKDKKTICQNKIIREFILRNMNITGKIRGLFGFEFVKKIRLFDQEFSAQNGLTTVSMKLKRNACKAKFKDQINDMYQTQSKL